MKRVLSNLKKVSPENVFRGRKVTFRKKLKRIFDMDDEEERAEYYFWTERYDWIIDITANTNVNDGGDKT